MLLPLFIPGVSAGLATALFFREVGIPPSLLTIAIVQVVWALPFATLVILIAMSTFDPVYLEAASMSGANRLRGFLDIELPLIRPGILGAATFSLILSFNETIRTSVVQGGYNTVQTYIWATYKQIGLVARALCADEPAHHPDACPGRGIPAAPDPRSTASPRAG